MNVIDGRGSVVVGGGVRQHPIQHGLIGGPGEHPVAAGMQLGADEPFHRPPPQDAVVIACAPARYEAHQGVGCHRVSGATTNNHHRW